jgi:hypothetical protein
LYYPKYNALHVDQPNVSNPKNSHLQFLTNLKKKKKRKESRKANNFQEISSHTKCLKTTKWLFWKHISTEQDTKLFPPQEIQLQIPVSSCLRKHEKNKRSVKKASNYVCAIKWTFRASNFGPAFVLYFLDVVNARNKIKNSFIAFIASLKTNFSGILLKNGHHCLNLKYVGDKTT